MRSIVLPSLVAGLDGACSLKLRPGSHVSGSETDGWMETGFGGAVGDVR